MNKGPSKIDGCAGSPPAALLRGIDEFNRGLFFEQHETLEDEWIEETGEVRYLYQGVLQIGVGFLHLQRGNYRGAVSLLERGMGYLRPFAPACLGIDVERLLTETQRALKTLTELGPRNMQDFSEGLIPNVHLLSEQREGCAHD
jgi:uncharacterized protein